MQPINVANATHRLVGCSFSNLIRHLLSNCYSVIPALISISSMKLHMREYEYHGMAH